MKTDNAHKIQKLRDLITEKFAHESTGHDVYHMERVVKQALYIAKIEKADELVVELAALLHDISDHKFNGGDEYKGSEEARNILNDLNFETDIVNHVCQIILEVSFKNGTNKYSPSTLESEIVQDADRLDAIGAIGVARTFAYGGFVGNPIFIPESPTSGKHTIAHFHEKLLKLKDLMHTESAKKIANLRHDFLCNYLEQFKTEWYA